MSDTVDRLGTLEGWRKEQGVRMPYMLMNDGKRLIEHVREKALLAKAGSE